MNRTLAAFILAMCPLASAATFDTVVIVTPDESYSQLETYADVLQTELERSTSVAIHRVHPNAIAADIPEWPFSENQLNIVIHNIEKLSGADQEKLFHWVGIDPVSQRDPGPEGFHLIDIGEKGLAGHSLHIYGVDYRGALYGIGELLRQVHFFTNTIAIPPKLSIRSAPAFEVRGANVGQGHTITEISNARDWTQGEWERAVTGYALAGANTISMGYSVSADDPKYQFVRDMGLKVLMSVNPNHGSGPPEWEAKEAIGRKGYLCLSIPEAREAKLAEENERWMRAPHVDYVRMKSGDGGGCECEKCRPYGRVYIRMCADIAKIIRRYRPNTEIFVLNQKLDNAGDMAIFEYLQNEPQSWLRAIAIGPGSNAMSWMPGRRQDHRMDLFRYPAFGAMDRYYREMLHQLPPTHDLVFFTDITHWVYAQNGLMDHALIPDRDHNLPPASDHYVYDRKPDPALAQTYDRRAFNARPKAYYDAFRESMRYGIGDVCYSEGHHDHFNQWMWFRLLWAPDTPLEEVIEDYATTFFGPEAAPFMTRAILQFEDNLQTPIADNEGIQRFAGLVAAAGKAMPKHRLEEDYLWRQYMQRALVDQYIQANYRQQVTAMTQIEKTCADGLEHGQEGHAISDSLAIIEEVGETAQMAAWKEQAHKLGEESDTIYGVRVAGLFMLDQDYVGLGWYQSQLEAAKSAAPEEVRGLLASIADYELKSLGAIYDDLGDPENSPHLTHGWPFGDGIFDQANRGSQRSCAFTTDEERGVTLEYKNLDPKKQYIARMTLVRPRYLERFGIFQHQTSQSIYADDIPLVENMELPEYTASFYEFAIPREATADGALEIWCKKQDGVGEGELGDVTVWRNTGGWGTLLSEVWLYPVTP